MTDLFKTIEMLARERNEMLATVTRTQERITRYIEVARAAKAHVDAWTNGKPSESDRAYLTLTQAVDALELVEGAALQTPPAPLQYELTRSIEPKLKKHLGHPSCPLVHASVGGWFLESECACPELDHSYDYRHQHWQPAVGTSGVVGISGVHSGHPDCPMTKGLPSGEWFGNCTCPQPQEKR